MSDALIHRGPDAAGLWVDEQFAALSHRRLSIVDLSSTGAQPMHSQDGRWVLTYNGELYNADDIRSRLRLSSRDLKGHSDTEVLVEALARWGVERSLKEAVGMFAFAAWDRQDGELWLARDRFGEKPLYYASTANCFVFASELPALEAGLPGRPELNRSALAELLRHHYVSAPSTIYEGVFQLPPGSWLLVREGQPSSPSRYWDPVDEATRVEQRNQTIEESVDQLQELLERTVRSRLVSDVPLGAFLSGGVDSSTIVSLMQQVTGETKTFTVGFEGAHRDESVVARQIAKSLGTTHSEQIASGADALAVVPRLARIYGEPFADASQIPTLLVCEHARRHVTVALSGDAGDELFGGYERYRYFEKLVRLRNAPAIVRDAGARSLHAVPASAVDGLARSRFGGMLPPAIRKRPAARARMLSRILRASSDTEAYQVLRAVNDDPWQLICGEPHRVSTLDDRLSNLGATRLGMMNDTLDYLPNDILTKVDRAAMAVSLETRVPFLDPEIFRFAWSLPTDHLVQNGVGKQVLRHLLGRYVPEEITSLPKRGFGVPLDDWLRGPLSTWAGELLDPALLAEDGILEPAVVHRLWTRHLEVKENLGPQLWPLVMFQSWKHDR